MRQKVNVNLEITEFECSPDELTERIGIQPTEKWKMGDILQWGERDIKIPVTARKNTWSIDSGAEESDSVEKHLESLLSMLMPYVKRIQYETARYPSMVRVSAIYNEYYPGIILSAEILDGLAAIGAEFGQDIKIYNKSE